MPEIFAPGDAIVKMAKASICGTDLHILKGDMPYIPTGRVMGHEGLGTVTSIGSSVSRFKVGDRVIIMPITNCSTCTFCKRGIYSNCTTGGGMLGNKIDGTHAEYVRILYADTNLHLAPEGIDESGLVAVSDALPTAFECGVSNGKVQPGSTVAIVGAGPVGLATLMIAQLYSPMTIIVIDKDENRLDTAKSLGATHTLVPGPNTVAKVLEITKGAGVDTAIEVVGMPATFELCQEITGVGGTIANVGVHGSKVDLHMEKLWNKGITIATSCVDGVSAPTVLKLVESGKIDPRPLISHTFKFSEITQAYTAFSAATTHKALKVIIDFE